MCPHLCSADLRCISALCVMRPGSGVPSCHVAVALRSAIHLWVLPSLEAGSACLAGPRNRTNPWFHSAQPTPFVNRPFSQLSCLFLFRVCHLFPAGTLTDPWVFHNPDLVLPSSHTPASLETSPPFPRTGSTLPPS